MAKEYFECAVVTRRGVNIKEIEELLERNTWTDSEVDNKIVITRPTVSNEDNGFLPGSLEEKLEPWLVPIRSNMRKVYNKPDILQKMESNEDIELVSLTHFRGRTFENAVCIVDEFQNLDKSQLTMC